MSGSLPHDPRAVQDEIIDSFSLFPEWLDRYQYLIDLGRMWLYLEGDAERITIRANSDAAIVSGLIALLTSVYSGCSARQIVDTEPYFIREIGLSDHLSPTRANGLHAMLNAIKSHALSLLH
jgi:cysteine desulfuration protein SufE